MPGRKRIYATKAERDKAYRARRKERDKAAVVSAEPQDPSPDVVVSDNSPNGEDARPSNKPASTVEIVASVADDDDELSFGDRLKRWARGEGRDIPKTATKGNIDKLTADELCKGAAIPILGLAFMAVPKEYRMTESEKEMVCMPLTRILMRRIPALANLSPDIVDGIAIVAAISFYVRRLQSEAAERERLANPNQQQPTQNNNRHQESHNGNANPGQSNGSVGPNPGAVGDAATVAAGTVPGSGVDLGGTQPLDDAFSRYLGGAPG